MKKLIISSKGLLFLIIAINSISCAQNKVAENRVETNNNQTSVKQKDFADRMQDPRFFSQIQSAMWTLTHDYTDSKLIDEVLKTTLSYLEAFEKNKKGNPEELNRLGGEKAFKDKLALWLNSGDQATRAYSATMLGVSGDKSYAPQIANLLNERKYKERDLIHYDRGRAAMALGMLEAAEYTEKLVELLKSENEVDRTGAAIGLGFLNAQAHAGEVKKLLKDKNENVRQAAQESLKLMKIN